MEPTNRHPERYDEPQRPTSIQSGPYAGDFVIIHSTFVPRASVAIALCVRYPELLKNGLFVVR
jgi:hypothetical protein